MNFRYKVRDSDGHISSGQGKAASRGAMLQSLKRRGLSPIAVIPEKQGGARKKDASAPSIWKTSIGRPVKDEEILLFTRDLFSLVRSGVPLVTGIRDIAGQIQNPGFRQALEQISEDINGGSKLSEALERHPKYFSPFYMSSVRAGEHAGRLEAILERLIRNLDHDVETRLLVKNAVRYPLIVLGFLAFAFGLIVTVVVPRIAAVFMRFDTELPLPTLILIAVGNFSQRYGLPLLALFVLTVAAVSKYRKTEKGRRIWDAVMLRLPVFGELVRKLSLSKFASTLQTLYASGVVLPEALEIASRVSGNVIIGSAIMSVSESVRAGQQLSETLRANRLFPPVVIRMVMTGEKTGTLEEMLGEIVDHYDRQIHYTTKSLGTMIEPILTVVLGLMILVLALGVFLPMWNVIKLFRH